MTRPPDRQLLSYLASYDPHISNLTLALREVVLQEAPNVIEYISKGYAVTIGFSFTGKPLKDGFCHIVTYSSYVNLGFNRGGAASRPEQSPGRYRQVDSTHNNPQPERTGASGYTKISSIGHRTDRRPPAPGHARS